MKKQYGVDSMPETGENVAEEFGVSPRGSGCLRRSQPGQGRRGAGRMAASAGKSCPVSVPQRKGDPVIVDTDEHPRAGTTIEALAKLRPPFRQGGTRHRRQCLGRQ